MHDGESYAKQTIEDPENNANLTVEWVKPDIDSNPNHWVLRVKGKALDETKTDMNDISMMWYLSTPDDLVAKFEDNHITGEQPDTGKYYLSFEEDFRNKNPSYVDLRNNSLLYDANYFYALTIDEKDQFNPKKYYF